MDLKGDAKLAREWWHFLRTAKCKLCRVRYSALGPQHECNGTSQKCMAAAAYSVGHSQKRARGCSIASL